MTELFARRTTLYRLWWHTCPYIIGVLCAYVILALLLTYDNLPRTMRWE